ncbi:MAG: DUF6807 family protein [Thermoguttaceae bacterium]|jgi:hypothetical protein
MDVRQRSLCSRLVQAWLVTAGAVLGPSQAAGGTGSFEFRQVSPTGLELSDGGKPVFVYNFGMILAPGFPESMRRSSYLHPVYAPDGTVLTDDFNKDHPHHRGISWMWSEVTVGGKKGDIWTVKEFQQRFVGWKARETGGAVARLAVENGWFDGDRKFVSEEVEILAHAASEGRRLLEFTLRLDAVDRPVQIAGTPEGKKGFGGFCFRFAPRDGGSAKTVIRTDEGIAEKDGVLARHPWAEISGVFHGRPAGARVEDVPSNPGYPKNGWLLRHGFGFLNVSYPGLEPITLEPGKPLVLKYRVILFAGPPPVGGAGK